MIRFWLFLLLVGLTFVPSAVHAQTTDGQESICANSAVVACDNFETRAVGGCNMSAAIFKFPAPGWGIPNSPTGCRVYPVNTQQQDGSKALEFHYPPLDNTNSGTGWVEHSFSALTTLYIRWFVKWSPNFVFPANSTGKQIAISNAATNPVHLGHVAGDRSVHVVVQDGGGATLSPNVGAPFTVVNNQWDCYEFRLTANTAPTAANGILEGWVNDVQKWSYNNVKFQTAGVMNFSYFMITGSGFNGPGGGSTPDQFRWVDRVVLSTARIGCGGTQQAAGPAAVQPSSPTGVGVR